MFNSLASNSVLAPRYSINNPAFKGRRIWNTVMAENQNVNIDNVACHSPARMSKNFFCVSMGSPSVISEWLRYRTKPRGSLSVVRHIESVDAGRALVVDRLQQNNSK